LHSEAWQPAQYYKQAFYLGSFRAWQARIAIVCGFDEASPGVELPNSCELSIRGSLSVEDQRQAMVGLIGVFRPVSGYASIDNVPRARLVESAPTVGWLTYLSSWFGEPPVLAEPAIVSAIPRYGSLIQALPGPLDANDAEQSAALRALADTLRAGGVLRPYGDGSQASQRH